MTIRRSDIDRSLAIFYHPLFQEIVDLYQNLIIKKQNENRKIGFLSFIEFNIKLQKALLPKFELYNAYTSALNDWMKELIDCFDYKSLFSAHSNSVNWDFNKELDNLQNEPLFPSKEYLKFIEPLKCHQAFKCSEYQIGKEVFSKFIFDLCSTWCELLDLEIFCYFLLALYLSLSQGSNLEQSQIRKIDQITYIGQEFNAILEEKKISYIQRYKKDLGYYRAWCEWNYLRLNQQAENIILSLTDIYTADEDQERIIDMIKIFENSIDVINQEIIIHLHSQQNLFQETYQRQPKTTRADSLQTQSQLNANSSITVTKYNNLSFLDSNNSSPRNHKRLSKKNSMKQLDNIIKNTYYNFNQQFQLDINFSNSNEILLKKVVKLPVIGQKIQSNNTKEAFNSPYNLNETNLQYYDFNSNSGMQKTPEKQWKQEETNLLSNQKYSNSQIKQQPTTSKQINQQIINIKRTLEYNRISNTLLNENRSKSQIKQFSPKNNDQIQDRIKSISIEDNQQQSNCQNQSFIFKNAALIQMDLSINKQIFPSITMQNKIEQSLKKNKQDQSLSITPKISELDNLGVNSIYNKFQLNGQGKIELPTLGKLTNLVKNKNSLQIMELLDHNINDIYNKRTINQQNQKQNKKQDTNTTIESIIMNKMQKRQRRKKLKELNDNRMSNITQLNQDQIYPETMHTATKQSINPTQEPSVAQQSQENQIDLSNYNLPTDNFEIFNLYRIIDYFKQKQNNDKQANVLDYVHLEFPVTQYNQNLITQIDKNDFKIRIQKILQRDLRRKERQNKKFKYKVIQEPLFNDSPIILQIKKYKSKINKNLYEDVFLPKILIKKK